MATDTLTRSAITLKGSARIVKEFFHYGINSILYQRGIYPAETFVREKKYGLTLLVTSDNKLKSFLEPLLRQIEVWLLKKKLKQLILVICNVETKETLERWQFDIETDETIDENNENSCGQKDEKKIKQEIADVIRQITASIAFLPFLEQNCSFDVLTITKSDTDMPEEWSESDARDIVGGEQVTRNTVRNCIEEIKSMQMRGKSELIARILNGFDPCEYGLAKDFVLTSLTQMKGCGCKVPQAVLLEMLKDFSKGSQGDGEIGIGLDSCVIPLRHKGLFLVQTTDFFYPLVDDPYLMGRITCCNVLSDLYAMGVVDCDNMLILLGLPKDFDAGHMDIIVSNFLKGFEDTAAEANTNIRGGQTVRCPWLLLGGVATSVCLKNEMATVDSAIIGDALVLTKPIGGQVAVNSYEWMKKNNGRIEELDLDKEKVKRAYQQVVEQMSRLNRNAARLALKYNSRASTDVTGFGLLGHANNLAKAQRNDVQFQINLLPIIEYTDHISRSMGNGFNLFSGTSAETSGGLLLAISKENAILFCEELEKMDGFPAWIIGEVVSGQRNAVIKKDPEIITIPSRIH